MWYIRKIFSYCGGRLIGEVLKKRREELGLDLREISQTLKIKYAYLKALEDDDLKGLPPDVYVKGYINEYAKILNLDPEPLLNDYNKLIVPQHDETPQFRGYNPAEKRGIKLIYILVPLVIIMVIIFISKQFTQGPQQQPPPLPKVETKQESPAPPATPQVETKTENPALPAGTQGAAVEEKQQAAPGQMTAPAPESHEQVIEVHAQDTTWLQVVIDGTETRELLMKPGETAKWTAQHSFSLLIGNAGGISILFNGKDIGKIGEEGQVVRMKLPADRH